MILLVLAAVVVAAAAAAGLLGVGVLSGDQRRERTGLMALVSAPVVLVVGLALLALLVLGIGGSPPGPAPAAGPRRPPTTPALPNAQVDRVSAEIPVVVIEAADADGFAPYRQVSGLVPGAVVRVEAGGFDSHERGAIEQCVVELGRRTTCGEAFPVQFDDDGRADFQFAVRGDIAPGRCRVGQATCLLRLAGRSSGLEGSVQTVLVDTVNPGQVRVEPAGGVTDGQRVEVEVSGYPPGTTATAVLCAPPAPYDAARCTTPAPDSTFTVDAGGTGRTTLIVAAGRLGPDAARCGPRQVCGVAVVAGPGFVAGPVTPVRFAEGPGVAYDAGRLAVGLLVASALAAVAVSIAVGTDWTKPTEAATPGLDGSDLRTGQSLDDLFGTDAALDERDPVAW